MTPALDDSVFPPRPLHHGHARHETDRYANLGEYERVAFFVNPTAGSPVGGAKEIVEAASHAGVTLPCFNVGDHSSAAWDGWDEAVIQGNFEYSWPSQWTRCDTAPRCQKLVGGDTANIESPEITAGFCTPEHAVQLVGTEGAVITEAAVPHADWSAVADAHMPVFIEIDPNLPIVREKGIQGLVEYGQQVTGTVVIPAFFATVSPWWDGSEKTWETYWDLLREQWPPPKPFAIYSAENVADWSVVA